ncbi:MAG: sulfatase-like hydrolase/transferase, partial [Leptospira sp.]|nr:sulfatase-like hydrolase/transferase [Leptospira sp.]
IGNLGRIFHLSIYSKILIPYRDLRFGLYFSISIYFLSLLLNTSFHIMGVNVSEFMETFLSQYYFLILSSQVQIIAVMIIFFSSISFLFVQFLKIKNFNLNWVYLIMVLICFNTWIHSMITYPQMYGEFFFIRFPFFQGILFFFTDHIPPLIPYALNCILFFVPLVYLLIYGFKNSSINHFVLLYGFLIFLIIHISSEIILLFFYLLVFPQIYARNQYIPKKIIHVFFAIIALSFAFAIQSFIKLDLQIPGVDSKKSKSVNSISNYPYPHIFLISVDSLRPDHIGFYNGEDDLTPNIDNFAKDSIHFLDHHVTIPRTFPSWADTLTGELSISHGIGTMFPDKESSGNLGKINNPTIPQILNELGYATKVVSGFAGDIFPRANFGFQETHTPNFNAKILSIQRGLESQILFIPIVTGSFFGGGRYFPEVDGIATLGDDKRLIPIFHEGIQKNMNRPIFMVYFSSVAHFPYSPPYPFYKKYTNPEYYGKYKYHKFVDPSDDIYPNEREIEQIRGLYKASIHSFDDSFGKLIHLLKEENIYEDSIIILTADHAESLFEENLGQGHGEHLRGEAVTRVPMMIKLPDSFLYTNSYKIEKSINYGGITSSLDIHPTVMELINQSQANTSGTSLLYQFKNPQEFKNRYVYSESGIWFSDKGNHFFQKNRIPYPNILEIHDVDFKDDFQIRINDSFYKKKISLAKYRSIQNSQFKLIYIPTREGVQFELYDRKLDPWNQNNLVDKKEYRGVFLRMREDFFQILEKNSKFHRVGDFLLSK